MKSASLASLLFFAAALPLSAQFKKSSIPLGDELGKARKKTLLTSNGSQPFHLRIVISEPENQQSPYQGTIEEWWISTDQWRREVTGKVGLKQIVVVLDGNCLGFNNLNEMNLDPAPCASSKSR